MAKVELKHPKESFESLFRRFKKAVDKDDVLKDCRKNEYHEKGSSKRKRAKAAALKREEKRRIQAALPARSVHDR